MGDIDEYDVSAWSMRDNCGGLEVFAPFAPSAWRIVAGVACEGAMATTAIEGNTLSEEEVRLIQEGKSTIPPSRKYLEQEVKNVLDALNTILADVVERNAIVSVTPEMIMERMNSRRDNPDCS